MMTMKELFGSLSASMVLLWQECGENPFVFCYRIGHGAFTTTRACVLVPVPVVVIPIHRHTRTCAACSNQFDTFSTHSMTRKD